MLSYLWDFHLETTSICCDACVVKGRWNERPC